MKHQKMLFVPAMLLAMTVSFTSCFDDDYKEPYNPYDPSNTEAKNAAFVTVRNDSTDSTQYWFEYDFGAKYKPVKNLIYDSYSPINSDKSKKDGKRAYITYNDAEGSTDAVKMVSLVSVTDLPTQDGEVVKSNSQVSSYGTYRMYVNQVNLSKDGKWLDLIVELQSRDAMNDVVAHKVNLIENTDDPDSISHKKGCHYLELHHNTGGVGNETTANYIMTYVSFRLPDAMNITKDYYQLVLKFKDKEGADRYLHISANGETSLSYRP